MIFRFNSREEKYKKPFGAVRSGERITFNIESVNGVYVNYIDLILTKNGEEDIRYPMLYSGTVNEISTFSVSLKLDNPGIYWYRFHVNSELGNTELYKGAHGAVDSYSRQKYQLTVYDKDYETPKSVKGGIIYHIFADRFNKGVDPDVSIDERVKEGAVHKDWSEEVTIVDADGVFRANDFYGGNIQGIIDKLDYLKYLNVTDIYLSPIFKSSSNHRYDTGDYMSIDELLGTEERFKELIVKAKEKGIGIILDGVFNHTGADSLYFNKYRHYDSFGAYQGIKSPYYDWYYFINYPNEYGCWWGITVTPTVNKHTQSYRDFILGKQGVIDKWSRLGIEGWRLDVVDELDSDFVDEIRRTVKNVDKDITIIGEVWEDASIKVAYGTMRPYLLGHQLDGVMNYPFKEAVLTYMSEKDKNAFCEKILTIYENYPLDSLNCSMNLLGTHDTVRVLNSLSGKVINGAKKLRLDYRLNEQERNIGIAKLKIASLLQYFLPGIPSVYYGDEIGMEGFEDPINRRPMCWNNIDNNLLEHYKFLGKLRGEYKELFCGNMEIIPHDTLLIIARKADNHRITAIINYSSDKSEVYSITGKDIVNGKDVNYVTLTQGAYSIIYE